MVNHNRNEMFTGDDYALSYTISKFCGSYENDRKIRPKSRLQSYELLWQAVVSIHNGALLSTSIATPRHFHWQIHVHVNHTYTLPIFQRKTYNNMFALQFQNRGRHEEGNYIRNKCKNCSKNYNFPPHI